MLRLKVSVSFALVILFILVTFSGIGLYYAPSGWKSANWTFFGIDKHTLKDLHTVAGFLFSFLCAIHVVLNSKLLISEIKAVKSGKRGQHGK